MIRKITGAAAALTLASAAIVGLAGGASASEACSPHASVAEASHTVHTDAVTHVEYRWVALTKDGAVYKWTASKKNPSTDLAHIWLPAISKGVQSTRVVEDAAAFDTLVIDAPAADAVVCIAGDPQPKVLHIDGNGNDQIYENPSEQYVPHITGHVTSGWNHGAAEITYVTDEGWTFADGSTTKVVTVNESLTTVAYPANPLTGINCVLATDGLSTPAGNDGYSFSPVINHIALNGKIGTTATASFGYQFPGGVTSKVFAATPSQVTLNIPTVVGGVANYGASTCGTWKVGSKVTLTDGAEFQTHGGTTQSGPVTRYRLVFTPAAGYTLPATLPGDGTKVSGSAVYLVYVPSV